MTDARDLIDLAEADPQALQVLDEEHDGDDDEAFRVQADDILGADEFNFADGNDLMAMLRINDGDMATGRGPFPSGKDHVKDGDRNLETRAHGETMVVNPLDTPDSNPSFFENSLDPFSPFGAPIKQPQHQRLSEPPGYRSRPADSPAFPATKIFPQKDELVDQTKEQRDIQAQLQMEAKEHWSQSVQERAIAETQPSQYAMHSHLQNLQQHSFQNQKHQFGKQPNAFVHLQSYVPQPTPPPLVNPFNEAVTGLYWSADRLHEKKASVAPGTQDLSAFSKLAGKRGASERGLNQTRRADCSSVTYPTRSATAQPPGQESVRRRRKASETRERQFRRPEQRTRPNETSRYDGLMTRYEIDLIARIQISQFVSADPFSDDYYYQVFSQVRRGGGDEFEPMPKAYVETLGRSRRSVQGFHAQIRRMMKEATKTGRKEHQFGVDGALGKIAMISVRNPKRVLDVAQSAPPQAPSSGPASRVPKWPQAVSQQERKLLAENVYARVLKLEQLQRREGYSTSGTTWPLMQSENEDLEAEDMMRDLILELWGLLELDNAGFNGTSPSRLMQLLTLEKGRRLFPRLIRYFNTNQLDILLLSLFKSLETLINPTEISSTKRQSGKALLRWAEITQSFMHYVVPSAVQIIADSGWPIINKCLELLVTSNTASSILRGRVGQAFLTMLLSRAELLKQQSKPSAENDNFINEWNSLYKILWNQVSSHFLSFFPPIVYYQHLRRALGDDIGPHGGTPSHHAPVGPSWIGLLLYAVDDIYAWQLMASLTVGSTQDQQHLLVAEVRSRIVLSASGYTKRRPLEPAMAFEDAEVEPSMLKAFEYQRFQISPHVNADGSAHHPSFLRGIWVDEQKLRDKFISNVNTFLHSLGLDASQVSAT